MKALGFRWCLLPLVIALLPPPVRAQTPDPGVPVRLTSTAPAGDRLVADLVRIDQDSVVVERGGAYWAFPRWAVTDIEVLGGEHRHTLRGALVGSLSVGVALGQDMLRKPSQCEGSGNYGQLCALFLVGAMAGGAVVGALVGAVVRHDEWVSVSLETTDTASGATRDLHRPPLMMVVFTPRVR